MKKIENGFEFPAIRSSSILKNSNSNGIKSPKTLNDSSLLPKIETEMKYNYLNKKEKESFNSHNLLQQPKEYSKLNSINTKNKADREKYIDKLDQQILTNLKKNIRDIEAENDKLRIELGEISRNYSALLMKSKEDSKKILSLEELLKTSTSNLNEENQKNSDSAQKNEINNLTSIIKELKNKNEELEDKLKEMKSSNSVNSENIANEKNKVKSLLEKKNDKEQMLNNMISRLHEQGKENQAEINSKNSLIKEFKQTIKKLKEESEKDKSSIIELNKENTESKNSIEIYKREINSYRAENERLINENEKSKTSSISENEYKNKLADLENQLNKISHENQEYESIASKLKSEIELAEKLLENEKTRNKELKKTLDGNYSTTNNLLDEVNKLKSTLQLKTEKINELEKDNKSKEEIISNYLKEKESISNEFENFKNVEMEYLSKNLSDITEINSKKDLENKRLLEKNNALCETIEKQDNRIKELEESVLIMKKDSAIKFNLNKKKEKESMKEFEEIIGLVNKKITNLQNTVQAKMKESNNKILVLKSIIENYKIRQTSKNDLKSSIIIDYDRIKKLEEENEHKNSSIKNLEGLNRNLLEQIKELKLNYNKEKKEMELFQEKLNKIVIENNKNKKEKENYEKINEENQRMVKQFNQANEIFHKLKLAVETLYLFVGCRECSSTVQDFITLKCGHSLCKLCITKLGRCVECNSAITNIDLTSMTTNYGLNELCKRVLYVNQVKDDISELIKLTKT